MDLTFVASPNFDLRIKDLNNNQLVHSACVIELKLKQCNSELESRIPSKFDAFSLMHGDVG
jgi:hypothetical protein